MKNQMYSLWDEGNADATLYNKLFSQGLKDLVMSDCAVVWIRDILIRNNHAYLSHVKIMML